jgi:hypothetical protein
MHDLALQAAGGLAIVAAIVHGVLGETKVFATAQIEPARARLLIRLVWQCSAVAWACVGILLIAAPHMESQTARQWIVAMAVAVYGFSAAANAYATRGRHFGWMVLAAVCVLALVGR